MQQYYIGKYLNNNGIRISFLSFDYGQKPLHNVSGVTFIKTYKSFEGVPGIRFFYPRLFKIWLGLKRADADLYYVRGEGFLPGVMSVFCKIHGKKWVFASAHDSNFIPSQLRLKFRRDQILYQYGIKKANSIIVQSENQRKLLIKNYNLCGTVIKNMYPNETNLLKRCENHILWVARFQRWKRPELLLKIAKKFPDEKFVMIGGPGSSKQFYANIKTEADTISNIEFKGFLPFEETKQYFDSAKFLINTSIFEGFPNTFLQSWCRGIPVITFFDPDGVVSRNNLGMVVSSPEEMCNAVYKMLDIYSSFSENVIKYYKEHHSPNIIEKYIDLFRLTLKG